MFGMIYPWISPKLCLAQEDGTQFWCLLIGCPNMLILSALSILLWKPQLLLFLLEKWFVCTGFQPALFLTGIRYSWAFFGRNFFACKARPSCVAPPIILKPNAKRRLWTKPWKNTYDASLTANPKHEANGYIGLSFATTYPRTYPSGFLLFRPCMAGHPRLWFVWATTPPPWIVLNSCFGSEMPCWMNCTHNFLWLKIKWDRFRTLSIWGLWGGWCCVSQATTISSTVPRKAPLWQVGSQVLWAIRNSCSCGCSGLQTWPSFSSKIYPVFHVS